MARDMWAVSTLHAHSPESACLVVAKSMTIPNESGGYATRVLDDGWFECSKRPSYLVHQHGDQMYAHLPFEGSRIVGCPDAA